jgi:hypothetical protein
MVKKQIYTDRRNCYTQVGAMLEDISRKAEKRLGKDRRHWRHYKYHIILNRNYFTRTARRGRPRR